jgi:hypothetical protein
MAKYDLNYLIAFPETENRPVYRTVRADGLWTSTVHRDNDTLGSGSGNLRKLPNELPLPTR